MKALAKTYAPKAFEKSVYERWESSGLFNPDKNPRIAKAEPFVIHMPPPNVTGVLHQGHALFVSIEDCYTRWKRMRGYRALWLPGTDHAGIATQLMVERMLEKEGTSRIKVGREEFLRRTWEWKETHGGIIQQQLRALGASCDWSRERFTMDEQSNRAVRESFIRLYHNGLIYRAKRLVNWSTGLQTAVSDLEVEQKPVEGTLYQIRYPLADGSGELVVATTRPETMFADTGVAVNPADERFKKFHGKKVKLPLTEREIPIVCDAHVDMEFGTGALKVTPGHDHNDWEIGKRHGLEVLTVIERSGKLNDLAGSLSGLDVKAGRRATVEKLEAQGFLVRKEKHNHEVGHCQRSGAVIEPLVSMQWWMKMGSLAEKALRAAKGGEESALRFFPDYWTKTYYEWMENIQDWCISRQLWWGHQIPAWHCHKCGEIMVPKQIDEPAPTSCAKCGSDDVTQDSDVLDTWYSSGLWPISTLGWPNQTQDLKDFYPQTKYTDTRERGKLNALMETGSDIIFFWVARMMMMCTHFMGGRIPFEDVYLHSIVRDSKGQKMSKTKGNVVDPLEIIAEHGADSLRLTLLVLAGGGKAINFDMKRLEGYKAFLNKLWNACRFVLPYMTANAAKLASNWSKREVEALHPQGRWILHRLNETGVEVNRQLEQYRFDLAFNAIYQFTWYEFCDWYVEFAKLQDLKDPQNQKVLYTCVLDILKLLHPLAPHVTEEIFSFLPGSDGKMLMVSDFPVDRPDLHASDSYVLELLQSTREVVEGIRNFRTENQISPRLEIDIYLQTTNAKVWKDMETVVRSLAKVKNAHVNTAAPSGPSGRVAVPGFDISIPLAGLVDTGAEAQRLETEIAKVREDLGFVEKRLANKNFVDKAKPELVEKERERLREFQGKLSALEESLRQLKA